MTSDTDFTFKEKKILEKDSIFLRSLPRGRRTVNGALFTPPSSHGSGSFTFFEAAASVHYRRFSTSINYIFELSESLYNPAAVEFIGFNIDTAVKIFTNFATRPDPEQNPDDLIDYVYGHISRLFMSFYQHYQSREAMILIDLSGNFQNAITNPRFSHIFGTETLIFWITDTLRINYLTLIQFERRLKNYAARSMAKNKAKRGSIEAVFQSLEPHPPAQAVPAATATLSTTTEDHNLPAAYVNVQDPGPILLNHYVLYKAKTAAEMTNSDWILSDGNLHMPAFASHDECDFSYFNSAWY